MGCFDEIQTTAVRCPLCGDRLGWQSKDGGCGLQKITPQQLMHGRESAKFYSDCERCSIWVEVSIDRRHPTPVEQYIQARRDRLGVDIEDDE